jgi:hypothetical protein
LGPPTRLFGPTRFSLPWQIDESKLKRSTRVDPIRARKLAFVEAGERAGFVGIGRAAFYRAEDTAFCLSDPTHRPPVVECGCGFYACDETPEVTASFDAITLSLAELDVELYGRVIRHTHGWRAERQRILQVLFDPVCSCKARATVLSNWYGEMPVGASYAERVFPVCDEHRPPENPTKGMIALEVTTLTDAERRFIYAELPVAVPPIVVTPAELENLIGTEVRWAA